MITSVSIHAPAGGATDCCQAEDRAHRFQFTRPQGARQKRNEQSKDRLQFQFTRPQGARQGDTFGSTATDRFQFTRPQGARQEIKNDQTKYLSVSIHAPTRGATPLTKRVSCEVLVSIHAPTRGATPIAQHDVCLHQCFNSRAHKGRDRCSCSIFISISYITYLRELHLKLRKYRIK